MEVEMPWFTGVNTNDSPHESPGSIPTIPRYFCPSARHFIHFAALVPGV